MRQDGFAQGAIKAGAKGGIIGASVYATKAGASKIGAKVSARLGGGNIPSDPHEDSQGENNNTPNNQQPINSNVNDGGNPQGGFGSENPEEYQTSRPLDGGVDQSLIPTTVNSEEYHSSGHSDGDGNSGSVYSSVNDEEFNTVAPHDSVAAAQPIPVSIDGGGQGSSYEPSKPAPVSPSGDTNSETWQAAKPVDSPKGASPIPTAVNSEGWNSSNPSGIPTAPATATQVSGSGVVSQQGETGSTVKSTAPVSQEAAAVQTPGGVAQTGAATIITSDSSVITHSTQANVDSSSNISSSSSDSVVVSETSSTHDSGSGYSFSQDSSGGGDDDFAGYESAPMPVYHQAISGDLPQSTMQPSITHDISAGDSAGASITPPDAAHSVQMQAVSETIRTDLPSAAQPQSAAVIGDSGSLAQPNTTLQSQTTQVNNVTKQDISNPIQPASQPVTKAVHIDKQGYGAQPATQPTAKNEAPNRPATKGKPKNPSVKGRKRRR